MGLASLRAAIASLPLALFSCPASAQEQGLTADRLYQFCHDRRSQDWERIGQWLCPAYIRGIVDGARLQAFHVTGSMETYKSVMQFCEPPGTTYDTAIMVVTRFVELKPESRPDSAAVTVYEALSAAWPCLR